MADMRGRTALAGLEDTVDVLVNNVGLARFATYSATRGAVESFTRALPGTGPFLGPCASPATIRA